MKRLKNISLFKATLFIIIAILLSIVLNYFDNDYISYGIVDSKKSNYYIIEKYLYKTKLITNDELQVGDVVFFIKSFNRNKNETELSKNIKYYGYYYERLFNFKPKNYLYNKVNSFSNNIKGALLKFLYNINSYDDLSFNLGYGFAIYYLFRYLFSKNKYLCLSLLIIYSFLFNFQIKFYILIIDFLLSFFILSKIDKYVFKLFVILALNRYLFINYSILIALLIDLYTLFDFNLDFKGYFSIIQSILFDEINIISSVFYKHYLMFQIFLVILSIIVLACPKLSFIYEFILNQYSNINNLNINIRGSISIIGLCLFLYTIKSFHINNNLIKDLLLVLIIISPINNPFCHVSFIDVGQGDATLIKLPLKSGNVLIDTGSKYNYYKLKKYLYSEGIYKIDYLIITHDDSDHNGNLNSLLDDFKVINVITEGQNIILSKLKLIYYDLGIFENDNDNSLVYGLSLNGLDYLFTGDISKDVEKVFVGKYGPINFDVLKVSHHGSNSTTSKYFLGSILPKYAIISTSGQYGHPANDTLANLDAYLVDFYITKYDKNIEFYSLFGLNVLKYGFANFVIISGR